MGRLADLFENYRGDVEESVKHALGRADDTLEALRNRVDELEAKLRDVAGEAPKPKEETPEENQSVVTSNKTSNTRSKK